MTKLDLEKLSAAKLWLISDPRNQESDNKPRNLTFLALALYSLVTVETESIARMTCDYKWRLYVNPSWLSSAPVTEIAQELAHVTWHLLANHADRARNMNVDRTTAGHWNEATDVAISQILEFDGMTLGQSLRHTWKKFDRGLSAEEYFRLLLNDSGSTTSKGISNFGRSVDEHHCGSCSDGIIREYEYFSNEDGVTPVEAESIRSQTWVKLQHDTNPYGADLAREILKAQRSHRAMVPWNQVLGAAIRHAARRTFGKGDFTYSRPSRRRSILTNVIFPGRKLVNPSISILIDTSGSMNQTVLSEALVEVDRVISSLDIRGEGVTIYSVDDSLRSIQKIRSAKEISLVGGGNTDLGAGLIAIAKERPNPEIVLILTDGLTPWPDNPPFKSSFFIALLDAGDEYEKLPPTPMWATRIECSTTQV